VQHRITLPNARQRADGTKLYIRDPADLSVSAVESDGLAAVSKILTLAYGDGFFGTSFHELNDLLYSDGGGVLDPTTHAVLGHYVFRTPLSQSDGVSVGLDPDSSTKLAFAAYDDPVPTALHRYSPALQAAFSSSISSSCSPRPRSGAAAAGSGAAGVTCDCGR
jgi:hypothetical protein